MATNVTLTRLEGITQSTKVMMSDGCGYLGYQMTHI